MRRIDPLFRRKNKKLPFKPLKNHAGDVSTEAAGVVYLLRM